MFELTDEDIDRTLDTSHHGFISREIRDETRDYLSNLLSYCCDIFNSQHSFDKSFPETNCTEPKDSDVINLLKFIKKLRLNKQWEFILRNSRSGWFFGLFSYIGDGYQVINRLLTNRCIEAGYNHCPEDLKVQAISDIRDMDMLFNFIPKTTKEFSVYRCYQSISNITPQRGKTFTYSTFLSTTLSFKFAKQYCDKSGYNDPVIIYIKIPKNSSICPIIDQRKINHTSAVRTEFEILLDRRGSLVKMTPSEKEEVLETLPPEEIQAIGAFFIYKSPESTTEYIIGGKVTRKKHKPKIKRKPTNKKI